ncbi:MAG: hypothetical protein AAF485_15165 [Chloroflexota bacterium]
MKQQKSLILAVSLLLIGYQLIRVIGFASVYGGFEHDGGWKLSVSRELAEHGTYTSMVSTLVDPNQPTGVDIDQKFNIQTPDGRIWFFTGNGTGPSSIIPQALPIMVFGTSYWALRAGPLIFYLLMLLLGTLIVYRLAGWGAILLLHAFLFFYPHLSIFLGYESMGEVPSMFYILWAYLAFVWATQKVERRLGAFFLAGLVIGLTINAKFITLFSVMGIFAWAGVLWLMRLQALYLPNNRWHRWLPSWSLGPNQDSPTVEAGTPQIGIAFRELLLLTIGIPLTLGLWELIQLITLTRLTSYEMYVKHLQQRIQFVLDDGSGVGLQIHSGAEFFWDKFFLLDEVAHPQRWVTALIFLAIFGGGLALLWAWRYQPAKQNLMGVLWFGWLANTTWFVILAKTGWPRHFWFGLILATLLLSVIATRLLRVGLDNGHLKLTFQQPDRAIPFLAGGVLLVLLGWSFVSQPHVWGFFLPDAIVPYWQEKQIQDKYDASLPWIIIPREDQAQIVEYIQQMPPEATVYYPSGHKTAEIPPQTGRIQYSLKRLDYFEPHPNDIVLIGPSLISPWKDPIRQRDLLSLVMRECPRPALQNNFYMICPIETNLSP